MNATLSLFDTPPQPTPSSGLAPTERERAGAAPERERASAAPERERAGAARDVELATSRGAPIAAEAADAPQTWLAGGFARRVEAWARAAGAPPESVQAVRDAAYAVSAATSSGHACTDLAAIGPDFTLTRAALLGSRMVAPSARPDGLPLVLDPDGRLYLHRYFDYERRIARRLARARPRALAPADQERLAARLAALFGPATSRGEVDRQKLAAALALRNAFTVISGGPGTGKTTTVVSLLACLVDLEPGARIALTAPTGKAAARMQDAIRERARSFDASLQARLPQDAYTIHRLLGTIPGSNAFRHHAVNPLPIDVLIVDEASMLDVALAAKLLDAVPEDARVVLLGDKDQLAAVESGAVFSELSAQPGLSATGIAELARLCAIPVASLGTLAGAAGPLQDAVMWLTHNFRFSADSAIGRLARAIQAGATEEALRTLGAGDASAALLVDTGYALGDEALAALRAGYAPYVDALRAGPENRDNLFDAFERFRVLCAEREGPRGAGALNEAIGRSLRQAIEGAAHVPARTPWYVGRPVMVLRNDYVLKLYNGDVGLALPDSTGHLGVHFREPDGSYRVVAPVRLPEHETAFATTVHKAQGSEFERVAIVLPARPSRVLTRELAYTAVTRARSAVAIVGSADILRVAVESPMVRHSGLRARLYEARRDPS